jgi:hypothetical protein
MTFSTVSVAGRFLFKTFFEKSPIVVVDEGIVAIFDSVKFNFLKENSFNVPN